MGRLPKVKFRILAEKIGLKECLVEKSTNDGLMTRPKFAIN